MCPLVLAKRITPAVSAKALASSLQQLLQTSLDQQDRCTYSTQAWEVRGISFDYTPNLSRMPSSSLGDSTGD